MGSKWMVDCNGDNGEGSEKAMQKALKDLDFADFINEQGGLVEAVQTEIETQGWQITDRGGGVGSWHIGVPFNDLNEATNYLAHMTETFKKAIGCGLLRFSLKTWSLSNWK